MGGSSQSTSTPSQPTVKSPRAIPPKNYREDSPEIEVVSEKKAPVRKSTKNFVHSFNNSLCVFMIICY